MGTLLGDLKDRATRLRDRGTVRMIECADTEMARLLLVDPKLKTLCLPAGKRKLVFGTSDELKVRAQLRRFGVYHAVWRVNQPTGVGISAKFFDSNAPGFSTAGVLASVSRSTLAAYAILCRLSTFRWQTPTPTCPWRFKPPLSRCTSTEIICSAFATISPAFPPFHPRTKIGPSATGRPTSGHIRNYCQMKTVGKTVGSAQRCVGLGSSQPFKTVQARQPRRPRAWSTNGTC